MSKKRFIFLKKNMDPQIFSANYQQKTLTLEGRLYSGLKTYSILPVDFDSTFFYCDTADMGDNYTAGLVCKIKKKQAWAVDVIYTKAGMEFTEPMTAAMLYENNVDLARIERNNGGRGFERAVGKLLDEKYEDHNVILKGFTQNNNKEARILSNSNYVMQNIFFPEGWGADPKWKAFYDSLMGYQREGKNKLDDAPDCVTGVAEWLQKPQAVSTIFQN